MSGYNIYEEKELFRAVAEGDKVAFRKLFHHYNSLLQPFIFKLTRSSPAAEEVIQEVFLKLWLHRDRLTGIDNPKAYIVRIASNESMNYLRALAKDKQLSEELGKRPEALSPSPDQSLLYRETEASLHEAIEQLPSACRQIYQMSREEYKRIPEIALELKLSDSTVKNQLVKALKIIRGRVEHTA